MLQRELRALCIIIKIQGSNKHGQKKPAFAIENETCKDSSQKNIMAIFLYYWFLYYVHQCQAKLSGIPQLQFGADRTP